MTNIDLFDEYAARIFAELYQSFPVKRSLNANQLSGHHEFNEFGVVVNENGEPSKQFEIAHGTIQWLWETGYIRGDSVSQTGMFNAVLSPVGLAVLKATPASLTAEVSTGEKLTTLVKDGAFDTAKDLVKSALTAGSALALGAIAG